MPSAQSRDDLLTLRDAARRIGVHENTIRNWIKRGLLDSVQSSGTRYRRFRAEDVDRIAHQQEVSSAKARRTEGTSELVDADYLDSWAGTRQAEELIPAVVKHLIEGARGVVGVRVRAEEGIRLAEWDGVVEDSLGNPWVPVGPSAWEIGTGGDPAGKADEDYRKRTADPLGVEPSLTTFVFVTPHRWPRAAQWERERRAEGVWRGVRVLDADDLAGWLRSQPATHLWLSEEVGLQPLEVRTLGRWWQSFSGQTQPALPPEFVLAGRGESVQRLVDRLNAPVASAVFVRATSKEEAAAFVAAALETKSSPPLVATSERGWNRLSVATEPAVLIPYFDDPDIAAAVAGGHRVIVPVAAGTGPSRHEIIELGPLDRNAARDVLLKLFGENSPGSFQKADRLAGLARRSLAAFLRDPEIAAGPLSRPLWAQGNHARRLACLLLAGSWTATDSDQRLVADIAGASWEELENELAAWSTSSDPPFIQSAGGWQLVSPDGAWAVLHHAVQASDLRRFLRAALEVLGERDPLLQIDQDDRILASVRGTRRAFSSALADGIAQGLALLGSSDASLPNGKALKDYADEAVAGLLRRANDDQSALLWRSISRQLQLLAEASPDEFLDAVEMGLEGDAPVLTGLFTDQQQSSIGNTTSEHTGLLWALELLCWSPDHLSGAASALARLVELDEPRGRLGNRPDRSLRTVFLPWIPQTSASLERRFQVLDRIRREHPAVAWNLEMAIMPAGYETSDLTARPRFRRWVSSEERAPLHEWLQAVTGTVTRVLHDADEHADRWADLVSHIADLPLDQRERVLIALEKLSLERSDDGSRLNLWQTLTELIARHRSFADARWSLDEPTLVRMEHAAERLQPADPVGRYAPLFDWHPPTPGVDRQDFREQERAVSDARADAIQRILASQGFAGIARLARESKVPEFVGAATAAVAPGDHFSEVLESLARPDELGRFARGWVTNMAYEGPRSWLRHRGTELPEWPLATQVAFLIALGAPNDQVLGFLASLDETAQRRYWTMVSPFAVDHAALGPVVRNLLEANRPWAAIEVLSFGLHRPVRDEASQIPVDLVTDAFDQALRSESTDRGRAGAAGYEVGQLLDYLAAQHVDEGELARFEWGFFRLLEHTRLPQALYESLARDPEFFVELVSRVYRGRNEPASAAGDEQTVAIAQNAWSVLNNWRRPPGLDNDGKIDSHHLRSWIRRARLLLADRDRGDIGDQQIGQVLSGAPPGSDGIRPPEEIRELIEDLASANLESGLIIGIHNARGPTTRGMLDGGKQEWSQARQYRAWADAVIDRWPRTGRLLRHVADDFERLARREDAEAHARANQF